MANNFNLLDFNPTTAKRNIIQLFSPLQGVPMLVSPANPYKIGVLLQAFTASDYFIGVTPMGVGPVISAIVGSVYPIQLELPTSDNIYVFQTILVSGTISVTESFID